MLKIHGVPISVHTRKVIVAARLKRLPFEVMPVVPVIPGSLPANWRELSPTGKIPALQDGDFTLADSAAICAYLERKQPEPSLYPRDDRGYSWALWLEQYAGGTVFRDVVHVLFHEVFVNPKVRGIATDPARVEPHRRAIGGVNTRATNETAAAPRDAERQWAAPMRAIKSALRILAGTV
jgi:glutathione S-transferase